jgi:hypothetical protein
VAAYWVKQAGAGRLGLLGWIRGENSNKLEFEFQGFWNLARFEKILQGDLEGIRTWDFFVNSSRFLKDF